jgi:methyltransferase (TIGR00027 family)
MGHDPATALTPAGRPSRTARAAALGRAIGIDGFHDTLAEQLLPWRDVVLARRLRRRLEGGESGRSGRLLRAVAGGFFAHAALRMLAIDRIVCAAVADGVSQVVLVGAGLDTRAWRLPELSSARVFEVDLPQTQDDKRRRLGGTPARADEVRFVAADLHRADLDWVLGHAGHAADEPTMWVAEAVAMYLPEPSVRATVATLAGRSAPGSRIALTFAVPELLGARGPGRALNPGARALFDLIGEPLETTLEEADVLALLAEVGFADAEVTDYSRWARDAGIEPPRNPLAAERLAVAVRR